MIIVVSGSRYLTDGKLVRRALKDFSNLDDSVVTLFHGGAPGVDTIADAYAKKHNWEIEKTAALWTQFGKVAGPIRNATMLLAAIFLAASYDDELIVLTFPGPKSKGTYNFIAIAKLLHLVPKVIRVAE